MTQINACDKKLALIKEIVDSLPEYSHLSPYHKSDYANIAFDEFIKAKGRVFPELIRYEFERVFRANGDSNAPS